MKTTTFDENTALNLYHQQRNDTEIGLALNMKPNAIYCWRRRNKLPSIGEPSTIHYSKVLTPMQSKEMKSFLNALLKGSKKCKQAGVKPDVSAAIVAWGNIPQSAAEHAISNAFAYREKVKG